MLSPASEGSTLWDAWPWWGAQTGRTRRTSVEFSGAGTPALVARSSSRSTRLGYYRTLALFYSSIGFEECPSSSSFSCLCTFLLISTCRIGPHQTDSALQSLTWRGYGTSTSSWFTYSSARTPHYYPHAHGFAVVSPGTMDAVHLVLYVQ